jgi:tetratricopeptide (TPR) repeat protein
MGAEMKRAAALIAIAGASMLAAQTQPQSTAAPNASQPANATVARPPIQTKTREEYEAYKVAMANAPNPPGMEKAADEFAAKFPNSDARVLLYRAAMSGYQEIGNPDKMMEMGMKVLAIDKDDPEALIGVAELLEERTTPTDLDRVQREAQVMDYATHALKTIDSDLAVPAGTAPERIEAYKKYLRSTALAIVGTIYYKQQNYPEAEAKLRDAISMDEATPDPVVVLRLALALDQQKKYADALQQANRAVELSREDTDLGRMARNERDRLVVQTGGTPNVSDTPAAPKASATQAPVPPANQTTPSAAPVH